MLIHTNHMSGSYVRPGSEQQQPEPECWEPECWEPEDWNQVLGAKYREPGSGSLVLGVVLGACVLGAWC